MQRALEEALMKNIHLQQVRAIRCYAHAQLSRFYLSSTPVWHREPGPPKAWCHEPGPPKA
jgi:hypothetical protein